jgi:uncharacterized protein (DUF1697 family)
MTVYLALLRGINVAGHTRVSMADLRNLLAGLGLADVRSVLQSGNLVFRGKGRSAAHFERLLGSEAETHLGLRTEFFVRTAEEWSAVVAANPFRSEAARDPGRLVVVSLKDAPGAQEVAALQAAIVGREVVRADGRHAYIVYPDGQGRSRLTNAVIERKLRTRGTARNWNTVLRLDACARGQD